MAKHRNWPEKGEKTFKSKDDPLPRGRHLPPNPHPEKTWRRTPAFEPTAEQREAVTMMAAVGIAQLRIADWLGISQTTLLKYFRKELTDAGLEFEMNLAGGMAKRAEAHDQVGQRAAEFILSRRYRDRWGEKSQVDLNVGLSLEAMLEESYRIAAEKAKKEKK